MRREIGRNRIEMNSEAMLPKIYFEKPDLEHIKILKKEFGFDIQEPIALEEYNSKEIYSLSLQSLFYYLK